MAFSNFEIQNIKNLMGYGNVTKVAFPYVDVALVFESVIQNSVDAYGENYVRNTVLVNLNQLDSDIMNARIRYQADELVGDVKLNKNEHERLLSLREFWLDRLSETIRIPRAIMSHGNSALDVY